MSKYVSDVRSLSANAAYQNVVFQGAIDEAIAQAKAAPDHGLAPQRYSAELGRNRAALLQHLGLLDKVRIDRTFVDSYAMPDNDPEPHYGVPVYLQEGDLDARFQALTPAQFDVYWETREFHGVRDSLAIAEAYPVRS